MEPSLGNYLRSERQARGISLSEIASVTRVSQLSLRFLEDDRYEDLPAEVYVRGYLRAYAQCIGLDPEEVIARRERPSSPTALQPLPKKGKLLLGKRRFSPPALLMILVWIVLIVAFMTVSALGRGAP